MDAQLKSQLTLTVSIKSESSRNNYGVPTFGGASTLSARVEKKSRIVETANGKEEKSEVVIISETEIPKTSLVFLPGASTSDVNNGYKPKRVDVLYDELGNVDFYRTIL